MNPFPGTHVPGSRLPPLRTPVFDQHRLMNHSSGSPRINWPLSINRRPIAGGAKMTVRKVP